MMKEEQKEDAIVFTTTIITAGGNTAGIEVPAEVVEKLGSKKAKVLVTLNGYTYRSSTASMGGRILIPVSVEVRKNSGVAQGDELEVKLVPDNEPRVVEVPADLQQALEADKKAMAFFNSLSYSDKRRLTIPINDAKTAETRQRRIDKLVSQMGEGKK